MKLVGLYYDLFREYNIPIGQVLTMKENFEVMNSIATRRRAWT